MSAPFPAPPGHYDAASELRNLYGLVAPHLQGASAPADALWIDASPRGLAALRHFWPKVPPSALRDIYTRGYCGVFATVVSELTGWPIYGVGAGRDLKRCTFYHVFVRQPDGLYLDVAGANQADADILDAWKSPYAGCMQIGAWTAPRRPFVRSAFVYDLCREIDVPRLFPDLSETFHDRHRPAVTAFPHGKGHWPRHSHDASALSA